MVYTGDTKILINWLCVSCPPQDEEWLEDFDSTCFSHHGPWDTKSSIQVCAAMLALPSTSYTFPQAVYLKILANPTRSVMHGMVFRSLRSKHKIVMYFILHAVYNVTLIVYKEWNYIPYINLCHQVWRLHPAGCLPVLSWVS